MKDIITEDSIVLQLEMGVPSVQTNTSNSTDQMEYISSFYLYQPDDAKKNVALYDGNGCIAWLTYVVLINNDDNFPAKAVLITAFRGGHRDIRYLLQQLLMHSWETGTHVAFAASDHKLFTETAFSKYPNTYLSKDICPNDEIMLMELSWEGKKKIEGKEWKIQN